MYFNTPKGCYKGDACPFAFSHKPNWIPKNKPATAPDNAPSNTDGSGNIDKNNKPKDGAIAALYTAKSKQQLVSETHHSVMVVGETGSGKSTLLNTVVNYLTGGTLHSPNIVIPTQHYPKATIGNFTSNETNVKNQAQSQTQECTTYSFKMKTPQQNKNHLFHFIDTPGGLMTLVVVQKMMPTSKRFVLQQNFKKYLKN